MVSGPHSPQAIRLVLLVYNQFNTTTAVLKLNAQMACAHHVDANSMTFSRYNVYYVHFRMSACRSFQPPGGAGGNILG